MTRPDSHSVCSTTPSTASGVSFTFRQCRTPSTPKSGGRERVRVEPVTRGRDRPRPVVTARLFRETLSAPTMTPAGLPEGNERFLEQRWVRLLVFKAAG